MSVTIAKDQVHVVLGRYILAVRVAGAAVVYPSLARKPPVARRKAGSNDPPSSEALDPCEGILLRGSVPELRSAKFWEDTMTV
jgi:hypothetical protein